LRRRPGLWCRTTEFRGQNRENRSNSRNNVPIAFCRHQSNGKLFVDIEHSLKAALLRLARPLVRIALRHGMPYTTFADLIKRAYVREAETSFALDGRKPTASRVSVITGLTRKEVAKLQAQPDLVDLETARARNRAARVLNAWVMQYGKANEEVAAIDWDAFVQLVRAASGDMPPRAVLDELERAGAVARQADGMLALLKRGYMPAGESASAAKLAIMGEHAHDLFAAIDHNITHPPEQAFLQRRIFFDNLPATALPQVRSQLTELGMQLQESARQIIGPADQGDDLSAPARSRAMFGVYYYEEAMPPAQAAEATQNQTGASSDQVE
jgi:hypothetical protein